MMEQVHRLLVRIFEIDADPGLKFTPSGFSDLKGSFRDLYEKNAAQSAHHLEGKSKFVRLYL